MSVASAPPAGLWQHVGVLQALQRLVTALDWQSAADSAEMTPVVGEQDLGAEVARATRWLGLMAAPAEGPWHDFAKALRRHAPLLLPLPRHGASAFVLVLQVRGSSARLLGPDGKVSNCDTDRLRQAVGGDLLQQTTARVEELVAPMGLRGRRRRVATRRLTHTYLDAQPLALGWALQPRQDPGFLRGWQRAALTRRLLAWLALQAGVVLMPALGWWLLGRDILLGRMTPGWFLGWMLAYLTLLALSWVAGHLRAQIALLAITLLKNHLMAQALQPRRTSRTGLGPSEIFGRVLEAEEMEAVAQEAGFGGVFSLLDFAMAGWLLSLGAAPWAHGVALALCVAAMLLLAWRVYRAQRAWTGLRLDMTTQLAEAMLGHRTRLAQSSPQQWHRQEAQSLQAYWEAACRMDDASVRLTGGMPRAWLVGAVLLLGVGAGTWSSSGVALSLAGSLLAFQALSRFATGLQATVTLRLAWEHVAPRDLARDPPIAADTLPLLLNVAEAPAPAALLHMNAVGYRRPQQVDSLLRGCDARIAAGDRIVLTGASGSGKTTLAKLMAGLEPLGSGRMTLRGLDQDSWGMGWRHRVVLVPQFHENHLVSAPLIFNLLMGCAWPPSPQHLDDAARVCQDLGLSELLERMPGGLYQLVGETGWQLSHGERSRIYVGRALLQKPDILLVDESIEALDPHTRQVVLRCMAAHARAVVLITHAAVTLPAGSPAAS